MKKIHIILLIILGLSCAQYSTLPDWQVVAYNKPVYQLAPHPSTRPYCELDTQRYWWGIEVETTYIPMVYEGGY